MKADLSEWCNSGRARFLRERLYLVTRVGARPPLGERGGARCVRAAGAPARATRAANEVLQLDMYELSDTFGTSFHPSYD